jgi:hypothetical protein
VARAAARALRDFGPGLRIPNPFTAAPVTRRPAATVIARWKASVEAFRAATRTSGLTPAAGRFSGATAARNAGLDTSTPGTWCEMAP